MRDIQTVLSLGGIKIVSDAASRREKKGNSLIKAIGDFTAIDLETTGLSTDYDSIIELGAVRYRNGKAVDKFEQLVYPGFGIDAYTTSITGITNQMLSSQPKISEVLPQFLSFVGTDIVVGHNVNFDINFLYDESEYCLARPFENDFIDTMRIAKRLHRKWGNYRLDTMIRELGVGTREIHRAVVDAELAAKCYLLMIADPGFRSATVPYYGAKAKDIVAQAGHIDEESPLYGKACVFTGALEKMTRKEAMQAVVDIGGICEDGITKKTNYLILGNNDYCKSIKDGKSLKHKKAERYKLEGQDIEIIPETVFYEMLVPSTAPDTMEQESLFVPDSADTLAQIKNLLSSVVEKNWLDQKLLAMDQKKVLFTAKFNGTVVVRIGFGDKPYIELPAIGSLRQYDTANRGKVKFPLKTLESALDFCSQIEEAITAVIDSIPTVYSCCSRYEQCSDSLRCVHPDRKMAMDCSYRKKLAKGIVFYGINRNVK